MYLLPTPVPIFKTATDTRIATDWKRALLLLRDSLEGRYGPIVVVAPWLPADHSEHQLEGVTLVDDEILLVPVFDARTRIRSYWLGAHNDAMAAIQAYLPRTQVLHGTVEEPMRPFTYSALMAAANAGLPTILVQDVDVPLAVRNRFQNEGTRKRLFAEAHAWLHEQQTRQAASVAGLCLLKGRANVRRYQSVAKNILQFEDTSYRLSEVVPKDTVRARLQSLLTTERPLRLVYCGRLVDIKGVDRSIRIVHLARERGARVEFDIIGSGPESDRLKALAARLGVSQAVNFLGAIPYGAALLRRMGQCDALLFNPRVSETPRMIFDGYAAGLPLVAAGIDYVLERSEAEQATVVLPLDDDVGATDAVVALDRDRQLMAPLTERAIDAGVLHAADTWYARRAEATHEMVERHRHRHPRTARPQANPSEFDPSDNREQLRRWMKSRNIRHVSVVSPHLDDAAFSLSEFLTVSDLPAREVITVITEPRFGSDAGYAHATGFEDPVAEFEQRREEDRNVMTLLGVPFAHAGFSGDGLTSEVAEAVVRLCLDGKVADETLVLLPAGAGQILGRSQQLVRRLRGRPVGSPSHVEHVWTRDHLRPGLDQRGAQIGYYAEVPYQWSDSELRIKALLTEAAGQPLVALRLSTNCNQKAEIAKVYRSQFELEFGTKGSFQRKTAGIDELLFLPA